MKTTLKELLPGQEGVVVKIKGQGALRRRIMDMGIVPQSRITMIRRAPLGDPLEIKLLGCLLSLRKEEADLVEIEPIEKPIENGSEEL